jgi:hypothetical protein
MSIEPKNDREMDHVVCMDAGAHEFENLVSGSKSMIVRGDNDVNLSYESVREGDTLYFINSIIEGEVFGRGMVSYVYKSDRLSEEESYESIIRNQDKLQLPDNQFYSMAGKRYLVFVGLNNVQEVEHFRIDNSKVANGDDWFVVGKINRVAVNHTV